MNSKKICINIPLFEEEIKKLKNEKVKLDNLRNKINNNYKELNDLNLEGSVITETKNNYEYGLEITNKLLANLEQQIENLEKTKDKYIETNEIIEEKVGGKGE